jgi:hypothetical protein
MNLYKYTDIEGANYILGDGTLLYSNPQDFNDPFDISIQTLWGFDSFSDESLRKIQECSVDVMVGLIDGEVNTKNTYSDKILLVKEALKSLSKKEEEDFKKEFLSESLEMIWDIGKLKKVEQELYEQFTTAYRNEGVTCFGNRPNSIGLWSHYADSHKGCVVELAPSVEKDSNLLLAKEVVYTNNRPFLYDSPLDFVKKAIFGKKAEDINNFTEKITLTKSLDWRGEEELRVCIPLFGQARTLLYHPEELVAIYLGCRMREEDMLNIISLAKSRNPEVKIYNMRMKPDKYELDYEEVR